MPKSKVLNMADLMQLLRENGKITDIQALASHPVLELLTLSGNDVKDLAPPMTLPSLKVVTLSPSQKDLAASLPEHIPFTVRYSD